MEPRPTVLEILVSEVFGDAGVDTRRDIVERVGCDRAPRRTSPVSIGRFKTVFMSSYLWQASQVRGPEFRDPCSWWAVWCHLYSETDAKCRSMICKTFSDNARYSAAVRKGREAVAKGEYCIRDIKVILSKETRLG